MAASPDGPEPPSPESPSSASAAAGPKASTGTRQPASDTRPRRAGTGAAGAPSLRAPGAPGASGRTSSGEASGPPPADGSCRVSSSWTALRTASPAAVLADPGDRPAGRPARRPGRRTDAAAAGARRTAPAAGRGGRSGSSAHRQSAPCAQTPWITRMTVLPIAPSPTLTSGLGQFTPRTAGAALLGRFLRGRRVRAGLGPGSPRPPTAASAFGAILRNCLFMDLSRKTRATPMAATTRNPSTPGVTSSLGGEDAATAAASTPNVKGTPSPGRPRTGRPRATRYPRQT